MILLNTPEIVALSKVGRGHTLDETDAAAMDRVFGKAVAAHAELSMMARSAERGKPQPKEPA